MMNRLNKILALLTALVMILLCAAAFAEEEPATPTDLEPVEEEEQIEPSEEPVLPAEEEKPEQEEQEEKPAEKKEEPAEAEDSEDGDAVESIEVVITKTVGINETWEGKILRKKPVVLKLEVKYARTIHLLAEGKDIWATVQKSDRMEDEPVRHESDPKTDRILIEWQAEPGNYLITLGAGENSLVAKATAIAMDDETARAWEESISEAQPEEPGEEEPTNEPEPETEPTPENPEEPENRPESGEPERSVHITLNWDTENPKYGDTAHFKSTMTGYEGLTYTLQWQTSWDEKTWTDYTGATQPDLDVTLTKELDGIYFRLVVFLEDGQEA